MRPLPRRVPKDAVARSDKYAVFALCRAWHKWPREFYQLGYEEQVELLAFEDLLAAEMAEVRAKHGDDN